MTRRQAYVYGLEAEWLAAALLRCKGYRILARRYVAAGGEIDLVAERLGTVVFVEVKARGTIEAARLTMTPDKCRRISRAARVFLAQRGRLPQTIRLDAIFMAPGCLPRHEHAVGTIDI